MELIKRMILTKKIQEPGTDIKDSNDKNIKDERERESWL
jgi:hypothetical protein